MEFALANLAFPVIIVGIDKRISIASDLEELTTCIPEALKKYVGSTILDLTGTKFRIIDAWKVSTRKPWWHRPLFLTIITADLKLQEQGAITLDELKMALKPALKRTGWDADHPELIPCLNQANSFSEVRAAFTPEMLSGQKWYEFERRKGPKGPSSR